jgi:hypothetical protein
MSDHLKLHSTRPPDDGDVTRALRELLAAPREDAYWRGLEGRILSRVRQGPTPTIAWWEELHAWARPALVAAAVVLLAVGVAVVRDRQLTHDSAYAAVLTPTALPVETAVRPVLLEPREATLRYLITP